MNMHCSRNIQTVAALVLCSMFVVGCSSSDVQDPEIQNSIQVSFEITVPAYQSDSLQVQLTWGEIKQQASWVGDEFWELTADFPMDTERQLVVTFYDKNGDVTLASYESVFKTGLNATEIYQISADQFDIDSWDTDGDGVSNLDESILGGDSVQLELRENYNDRPRVTDRFETAVYEKRVPDERPYFEYLEVEPTENPEPGGQLLGEDRTLTIDIDEAGNGTLTESLVSYKYPGSTFSDDIAATRTNTGNSIIWNAMSERHDFNSAVRFLNTIVVELQRIDAETRSAEGTFIARTVNTGPNTTSASKFALTGELMADSTACEPNTGEVTQVYKSGIWVEKFNTVSKSVDDQFWTVIETTFNIGEYQITNDESIFDQPDYAGIVNTYLTRTLGITFYCDYPELR